MPSFLKKRFALLLAALFLLPLHAGTTVDILILVDKTAAAALDAAGKDPGDAANLAISELNQVLQKSGIRDVRVRLAHWAKVDYTSLTHFSRNTHGEEMGDDLERLARGQVPGAQRLRNEKAADLVVMLVYFPMPRDGLCLLGISTGLTPSRQSPSENCAFGVINTVHLWTGTYTFSHEMGHLFGCGHSDIHPTQGGPQYHGYSAGYYDDVLIRRRIANGYVGTLMCYRYLPRNGTQYDAVVLPCFSRPAKYTLPENVNGAPMEVTLGDSSHNNALTFRQNAVKVAQYRKGSNDSPAPSVPSPSSPAPAPTSNPTPTPPTPSSPPSPPPSGSPSSSGSSLSGNDFLLVLLLLVSGASAVLSLVSLRRSSARNAVAAPPQASDPWKPASPPPVLGSDSQVRLCGVLEEERRVEYAVSTGAVERAGRYTIGRAPDNHLSIPDRSISSHHAELRICHGSLYLEDLGSTNGTSVNGRRLGRKECMQLCDGDEIALGTATFRLEEIKHN